MKIKIKDILLNMLGGIILSFGLYNVHSVSGITEGGILGLSLWLDHHFSVSPAISNFIFNVMCYLLGLKVLGKMFIVYSAFAGVAFCLSYGIFEMFPRVLPSMASHPFLAATVGAMFVGIGIGISVRHGGAPGGDDALAMSLSEIFHMRIQWAYLASDLTVILLSLSYIPVKKLIWSLYTVLLSGQIIGWVQNFRINKKDE